MKIGIFVLFFGVFLHFVQTAQAHVLATDNNIGAILHVDPNDDPIAGEQAGFLFEFLDKQNKFQPKICDCTFLISENGVEIFSQPLFKLNPNPSLNQASVFYTFPKIDVYQIQVIGTPTVPNGFQPFTLTWNWRVDQAVSPKDQPSQNAGNDITELVGRFAGGIVFLLLAFVVYAGFLRKRPGTKKRDTQKDREHLKDTY
jgi:hypothetical protein